jgi:putative pyruvate formate lyase activating enzyme
MWEEPVISGARGSGTIFFSGCSLGCIYCQNAEISRGLFGKEVSEERLADIMLELDRRGAHNINLVTGTHFAPSIVRAVSLARSAGLSVPVVYNTGSYDTPETIDMLKDSVDIWLPDLKYYRGKTAAAYSRAENLPEASRIAIDRMYEYAGTPVLDGEGIMQSGVIVRILLLPGHLAEAKLNLKYLYERYKDGVYVSLMSQYTPPEGMPSPLCRRVSAREYRELVSYAQTIGVKNAFVQDRSSAVSDFTPSFDLSGV